MRQMILRPGQRKGRICELVYTTQLIAADVVKRGLPVIGSHVPSRSSDASRPRELLPWKNMVKYTQDLQLPPIGLIGMQFSRDSTVLMAITKPYKSASSLRPRYDFIAWDLEGGRKLPQFVMEHGVFINLYEKETVTDVKRSGIGRHEQILDHLYFLSIRWWSIGEFGSSQDPDESNPIGDCCLPPFPRP